jgi:hypothetical protein
LGAKQKKKERKRNIFWVVSQIGLKPNTLKPNTRKAQDLLGPISGNSRPKPNLQAHPNLQVFIENPTSPIRSLAEIK